MSEVCSPLGGASVRRSRRGPEIAHGREVSPGQAAVRAKSGSRCGAESTRHGRRLHGVGYVASMSPGGHGARPRAGRRRLTRRTAAPPSAGGWSSACSGSVRARDRHRDPGPGRADRPCWHRSSSATRPGSPRCCPVGDTFRFYSVTGSVPTRDAASYRLTVGGLVDRPTTLTLADLQAMPQTSLVRDFQCVTGWRVPQVHWSGVQLSTAARPRRRAGRGTGDPADVVRRHLHRQPDPRPGAPARLSSSR